MPTSPRTWPRRPKDVTILLATIAAVGLTVSACGEDEPAGVPETALPYRSDEKLIEGVGKPAAVDSDPTPQSGTGGTIPNYDAAEPELRDDPNAAREEPASEAGEKSQ